MENRYVQLITDIAHLKRTLKPVLTSDCKDVFDDIISQIRAFWGQDFWEYEIPKETPLTFRIDDVGQGIQFDVYGHFKGSKDRSHISKQSFTVRIWSLVENLSVNNRYEKTEFHEFLKDQSFRRVIMRFRFEKEEGDGYVYHIQIGGYDRSNDEYCSIPQGLDVPKIPFYPMTIFSVCEFIISSVFPELWSNLKEDTEWNRTICRSQNAMIEYNDNLDLCIGCRILGEKKYCSDPRSLMNRLYQ